MAIRRSSRSGRSPGTAGSWPRTTARSVGASDLFGGDGSRGRVPNTLPRSIVSIGGATGALRLPGGAFGSRGRARSGGGGRGRSGMTPPRRHRLRHGGRGAGAWQMASGPTRRGRHLWRTPRPRRSRGPASRCSRRPALLSWGLAGGLDPQLAPGTLVVADRVIGPEYGPGASRLSVTSAASGCPERTRPSASEQPTPPEATCSLLPRGGGRGSGGSHRPHPLCPRPLCSPARDGPPRRRLKAALRASTGAAAVDMETHRVAAVAARAGCAALPCAPFPTRPAGRCRRLRLTRSVAHGRPRIGAVLRRPCAAARRPAGAARRGARQPGGAGGAQAGAADACYEALLRR